MYWTGPSIGEFIVFTGIVSLAGWAVWEGIFWVASVFLRGLGA